MSETLIRVETESGAVYLFDESGRVRRAGSSETDMRRDGDWLKLLKEPKYEVGLPMFLILEPLGLGVATTRSTTPVVSIEELAVPTTPRFSNHGQIQPGGTK